MATTVVMSASQGPGSVLKEVTMFPDGFAATGCLILVGCVGVWIYRRGAAGNDSLPPWEAYHRALNDAQAARGQFLRDGFLATARSLRDRICRKAQKWHIRFCPLCC
jgi:hypothetical protein